MKAFLSVFIFKPFIFIVIAPVASMGAIPHTQVDTSAHRLLNTPKSSVVSLLQPNVVFIFADDMGYGDVKVLNPERGKISTPHMDALALDGMIFTDAHTSSSVCTPSRYSLMTGRYNWRTTRQAGVIGGFGRALIPTSRKTIASLLKGQGYNTAMIGKWHLGLKLPSKSGKPIRERNSEDVDWGGRIEGGPVDLGFDSWYGIAASLDMPPYIYIQDDRFVGEATVLREFTRRKGFAHPDFNLVDVLPEIGRQTVEFIQNQKGAGPFFAYVPLTSPHTHSPRKGLVSTKRYQYLYGLRYAH